LKEVSGVLFRKPINPKIMSKEPNYTEAFEELQGIVLEIEQGEISVDALSEKVKRAAVLIKICKAKLTSTEEDVSRILKELEKSTEENG
jgi:exodeoxyribonuclease VII small subunit